MKLCPHRENSNALWASARRRLPVSSPLREPDPFAPGQVISLGGVGDLESFAKFVPILCGPGISNG